MNEKIRAMHVQVAEKLIEQLQAGTAPWQKPWGIGGAPAFELPYNAVTGVRYKGINIFSLLTAGREDPRWMTYNQAAANHWNVKKGEKGSLIQFVKVNDLIAKRDEHGRPILDQGGKPVKIDVKLDRPIVTNAWVFNADQVDGIPDLIRPDLGALSWNPIERAERLVASSGAQIMHKQGDNAYYDAARDLITVPEKQQFWAADRYYATLLHELGHWTGHRDRLDRSIMNEFGTEGYAREELRAEIASLLIGQELGIGHDPGQHAAYVESWIRVLRDTPFEIQAAAADAEKIFAYLIALEQKREMKAEVARPRDREEREASTKSKYLMLGDQIAYNDAIYSVQGHLKQGRLRMEDLATGRAFVLSRNDRLYTSLLEAKNRTILSPAVTTGPKGAISGETEQVISHGPKR